MTAPQTSRADVNWNLNHLRRGVTYRAKTQDGIVIGDYLGMETAHGDRAILLRHGAGTESIELCQVISMQPTAV